MANFIINLLIKLCGYLCGVIPAVSVFVVLLAGLCNILKQCDLNSDSGLILNTNEILNAISKVTISLFAVWMVSFLFLLLI